ncbi:hypothetical protein [Kitasatospora sp. NPDC097643]|uniref:hypothetical protein n=1 Tax=Kitasatospora sp. NPDC097643 TaxID=3157230 RepID=UPI00332FF933
MPSRIPGRRRAAGLAGFAGLVLTVGLALTGCDPSAADGGTRATSSPTATATAAATATATAAATTAVTTPPPPPAASTVTPTPAAPAPASSHAQPPASAVPQPKATTAQPPTDPAPQQTTAAAGDCELRSAAGNCYEAGQFCRTADLGKNTHDAKGRVIYCRMVSGKPHWQA